MDKKFSVSNGSLINTNNTYIYRNWSELINWAQLESYKGRFKDSAVREFSREENADAWLVATAKYMETLGYESIIVTEENSNPDTKNKILIPIAAIEVFSIKCIKFQKFMIEEKIVLR